MLHVRAVLGQDVRTLAAYRGGVVAPDGRQRNDPYGDVIAESRALGDDMVVADLDASVLHTSSGRRWLRARRPDLYKSLTRPHRPGARDLACAVRGVS